MNTFWDDRYSTEEFVFGKSPNVFLKSVIDKLTPGKILIPAAGEGRDAVYAAKLGWDVFAFDQSVVGKQKALKYAKEENTIINYEVMDALDFDSTKDTYDAIALIYFHLEPEVRKQFNLTMIKSLSPNGLIILEAFTPNQRKNSSGGPSEISRLLTPEIIRKEFSELHILKCAEEQILLNEGHGHSGKADVVRFIGKNIKRLD